MINELYFKECYRGNRRQVEEEIMGAQLNVYYSFFPEKRATEEDTKKFLIKELLKKRNNETVI